jgi:hypothetical protein
VPTVSQCSSRNRADLGDEALQAVPHKIVTRMM